MPTNNQLTWQMSTLESSEKEIEEKGRLEICFFAKYAYLLIRIPFLIVILTDSSEFYSISD